MSVSVQLWLVLDTQTGLALAGVRLQGRLDHVCLVSSEHFARLGLRLDSQSICESASSRTLRLNL